MAWGGLEAVGVAELVDKALRSLGLLHDALLVVLADGSAQLVVVHRRTVLSLAPEPRHAHRVLDLEDALVPVKPPDGGAVLLRRLQELLQELPQVDVGAAPAAAAAGGVVLIWGGGGNAVRLGCNYTQYL